MPLRTKSPIARVSASAAPKKAVFNQGPLIQPGNPNPPAPQLHAVGGNRGAPSSRVKQPPGKDGNVA